MSLKVVTVHEMFVTLNDMYGDGTTLLNANGAYRDDVRSCEAYTLKNVYDCT